MSNTLTQHDVLNTTFADQTIGLTLWGQPVAVPISSDEREGGLPVSGARVKTPKSIDPLTLTWNEENAKSIKSALAAIVTDVNNAKCDVDFSVIAPFYEYVEGSIRGLTAKHAAKEVRDNPRYTGCTWKVSRQQYSQVYDLYLSHRTIAGLAVLYWKHKQGQNLAAMAEMIDRYNAGDDITPDDWEAIGLSTYKGKPTLLSRQETGVVAMVGWATASHEGQGKRYKKVDTQALEGSTDWQDQMALRNIKVIAGMPYKTTDDVLDTIESDPLDEHRWIGLGGDLGIDKILIHAGIKRGSQAFTVMKMILGLERRTRKDIADDLGISDTAVRMYCSRAMKKIMDTCQSNDPVKQAKFEEFCNLFGITPNTRKPMDMAAYLEQIQAPGHLGAYGTMPSTPGYTKPESATVLVSPTREYGGYGCYREVKNNEPLVKALVNAKGWTRDKILSLLEYVSYPVNE